MWVGIFDTMLSGFARAGRLRVAFPDGTERSYGPGPEQGVKLTITENRSVRRIVLSPEMGLGEAYMDGTLILENDDLDGFFTFFSRNADAAASLWWRRIALAVRALKRPLDQANRLTRARRNVAHHYDLSSDLYDLFLDADRQYSCAYFARPDMSLEEAQAAKKAHIAAKLLLEPGMEVFEIGCGWGGLALSLARDHGARVLGVTLSEEQHSYAVARARAEGLDHLVRFELRDYRTVTKTFDRVVSVGMFEHVGVPHYTEYFETVRDRLKPDGVALIHTIGRLGKPANTSPWIAKYIFPGGYAPSYSEMVARVEPTGLLATDLEVWRLHYAETLKAWDARFSARREAARALYDDRFCRMWRYYLKAAEHTFRHRNQVVFQLQLARHQEAVPLTRDYLYPAPNHHLAAAE